MASEHAGRLPEELNAWVSDRAEAADLDRSEVLERAVEAYRFLEEEGDALAVGDGEGDLVVELDDESDLLDRLEALERRAETLDDLDERVGDLETDLDEKIEDVRARVVQVKRETDGKAPVDHEHDVLHQEIDDAAATAEDAGELAAAVRDRLASVEEGFENYEDILEYVTDTTDDLEGKVDVLAGAIIDLRQRLSALEGRTSARAAADDLREEANRNGIDAAKCADCGAAVRLGLLTSPRCPHCETTFGRLVPASGFFGSATLEEGDRPALTSGDPDEPGSPDDLFDGEEG